MELPTTAIRSGPVPDWPPADACTLPTPDRPLRAAEFDEVFAATLRAVERPAGSVTRARLVLAADGGMRDRVQRLADAESSCCSFFDFTITPLPGDGTLALDIEVPAAHA